MKLIITLEMGLLECFWGDSSCLSFFSLLPCMTFYSFCFALLLPTNSLLAHNFGSNCSIFELFIEMIEVIKFLSHMHPTNWNVVNFNLSTNFNKFHVLNFTWWYRSLYGLLFLEKVTGFLCANMLEMSPCFYSFL